MNIDIIQTVVETLDRYPTIKYKKQSENEISISGTNELGFNILLQTNERENTLHLGTYHSHFGNTDEELTEMLDMLLFALTGVARIKEFSKNSNAYKWTLQIQDKESVWHDYGTMSVVNFNFWSKSHIRYLQNHELPLNILQ